MPNLTLLAKMYDVAYYYRKRLVSFACFFFFRKGIPNFFILQAGRTTVQFFIGGSRLDQFRRNYSPDRTLCRQFFTQNRNLQNDTHRSIDLSSIFPANGLVSIHLVDRSQFAHAFFGCLHLSAVNVFTHGPAPAGRFDWKRLIFLYFSVHRRWEPCFHIFRPCMAIIRMAWHYHMVFDFTGDIPIHYVDHRVEGNGYAKEEK